MLVIEKLQHICLLLCLKFLRLLVLSIYLNKLLCYVKNYKLSVFFNSWNLISCESLIRNVYETKKVNLFKFLVYYWYIIFIWWLKLQFGNFDY